MYTIYYTYSIFAFLLTIAILHVITVLYDILQYLYY